MACDFEHAASRRLSPAAFRHPLVQVHRGAGAVRLRRSRGAPRGLLLRGAAGQAQGRAGAQVGRPQAEGAAAAVARGGAGPYGRRACYVVAVVQRSSHAVGGVVATDKQHGAALVEGRGQCWRSRVAMAGTPSRRAAAQLCLVAGRCCGCTWCNGAGSGPRRAAGWL